MCVCKALHTRGIWERRRAEIAALSVFLITRSKNHSLQPMCVQFLLFRQRDLALAYNQGPSPTKLPDCMGYRVWSTLRTCLLTWPEAKPRTSIFSTLLTFTTFMIFTMFTMGLYFLTRQGMTFEYVRSSFTTGATLFYFKDGPYSISMKLPTWHEFDQIILMRPFSCRMSTPPIPTRPR